MKFTILLAILFAGNVSGYSRGPPCGALNPRHGVGGQTPAVGQFQLTFDPPLDNGRAQLGREYRIRVQERMQGFAMQIDNGEVITDGVCTQTCNRNKYISHSNPGCGLDVTWKPDRSGNAGFQYTIVVAKREYYPNLSRQIQVAPVQQRRAAEGPSGPSPVEQGPSGRLPDRRRCRNFSGWDRYCSSNIRGICSAFARQCPLKCDPQCQ